MDSPSTPRKPHNGDNSTTDSQPTSPDNGVKIILSPSKSSPTKAAEQEQLRRKEFLLVLDLNNVDIKAKQVAEAAAYTAAGQKVFQFSPEETTAVLHLSGPSIDKFTDAGFTHAETFKFLREAMYYPESPSFMNINPIFYVTFEDIATRAVLYDAHVDMERLQTIDLKIVTGFRVEYQRITAIDHFRARIHGTFENFPKYRMLAILPTYPTDLNIPGIEVFWHDGYVIIGTIAPRRFKEMVAAAEKINSPDKCDNRWCDCETVLAPDDIYEWQEIKEVSGVLFDDRFSYDDMLWRMETSTVEEQDFREVDNFPRFAPSCEALKEFGIWGTPPPPEPENPYDDEDEEGSEEESEDDDSKDGDDEDEEGDGDTYEE